MNPQASLTAPIRDTRDLRTDAGRNLSCSVVNYQILPHMIPSLCSALVSELISLHLPAFSTRHSPPHLYLLDHYHMLEVCLTSTSSPTMTSLHLYTQTDPIVTSQFRSGEAHRHSSTPVHVRLDMAAQPVRRLSFCAIQLDCIRLAIRWQVNVSP